MPVSTQFPFSSFLNVEVEREETAAAEVDLFRLGIARVTRDFFRSLNGHRVSLEQKPRERQPGRFSTDLVLANHMQ